MSIAEKVLNIFNNNLLDFIKNLSGAIPTDNDLANISRFISSAIIPMKDDIAINIFYNFVSVKYNKYIENKDIDGILSLDLENDGDILELYENNDENKLSMIMEKFRNYIKSGDLNDDDIEISFEYLLKLDKLARKYKQLIDDEQ